MSRSKSVLVLTSCTGLKAADSPAGRTPAERLYVGEQHRRVMRGVEAFRGVSSGYKLDLKIISAGYGIIDGAEAVPLYDASFAGLGAAEIDRRSEALGIPQDCRALLAAPRALTLVLLGGDYLRASALGPDAALGGPAIVFGGAQASRLLTDNAQIRVIAAGREEARRFSCGLVGLKGELGGRLLELLAREPGLLPELGNPALDVLGLLAPASSPPVRIAA